MTIADRMRNGIWRIIRDGMIVRKMNSAEEAQFVLACEGRTIVAEVDYPKYNVFIMWTDDFLGLQMSIRETKGRWTVCWSRHYEIKSFPDRDSAFEWVRNSFDGEKTFRKTSDAEYVVRFGRKA